VGVALSEAKGLLVAWHAANLLGQFFYKLPVSASVGVVVKRRWQRSRPLLFL
jgi:hypothetical protein